MSGGYEPIRSYQRIFSPERRIHQVEGRPLPVPGGVPLRWLGWAAATLVAVLVLGSGSVLVPVGAAAAAGAGGLAIGDRTAGLLAAAAALAGTFLAGVLLGALDWPLRLVVVPAAVASIATQATPDGRRPERFALSWVALRLAPRRRSLGRAVPLAGLPQLLAGELWVASDEGGPRLRRARIAGPAVVFFARPMRLRGGLPGRRRLVAREPGRLTRRSSTWRRVMVPDGRRLEVRP
ncbi:MAG: hypothetical protein JSU06_10255 [Actinobacteria bacterium]|nr:hypothetical protein [Actinomycetota bacterium]